MSKQLALAIVLIACALMGSAYFGIPQHAQQERIQDAIDQMEQTNKQIDQDYCEQLKQAHAANLLHVKCE